MRRKENGKAWRETPRGVEAYRKVRAEAQAKANALGIDVGLEANDLFREWRFFLLPKAENRRGHELRCEVVMPEKKT